MFIPDLHEYGNNEESQKVVDSFLSEERRKAIQKEIEYIVYDEFSRFELHANQFLSDVAAQRAENFLLRILDGDENAAMALLGDKNGSDRYRTPDKKPWASLIHGHLFETTGIKLRRKIVEAHSDFIVSERIKDLESIVAGLSNQIVNLESEVKRLRDDY